MGRLDCYSRAIVGWILGIVAAMIAYIVIQGRHVGIQQFFTPWHHDDFAVFSGHEVLPLVVRPISTNFIFFFGQFGETSYYIIFALLGFATLTTTSFFVAKIFGHRNTPETSAIYVFVGSAIWFACAPSVQNLQYLGLVTNGLSILLGMIAALIYFRALNYPQWSMSRNFLLSGFFLFSLLSAFSKEDMAAFLFVVASGVPLFFSASEARMRVRMTTAATGMVLVTTCYVACLIYSKMLHSPFVGGTGPYDITRFPQNIATNFFFYLTASPATMALLLTVVCVALVSGLYSIKRAAPRQLFKTSFFVLVCSIALMLPYLILPRQFDYYAMNFIPVIVFSIAPMARTIVSLVVPKFGILTKGSIALAAAGVFLMIAVKIDQPLRKNNLLWMQITKENSVKQLREIKRASDLGLLSCEKIYVTGVDSVFGPFFNTDAGYLTRLLGKAISWSIYAPQGSFLEGFASTRVFDNSRWRYTQDMGPNFCRLDFNPKSLRATFAGSGR